MKANEYRELMGELDMTPELKNKIMHSAALGRTPSPLGERRSHPRLMKVLSVAATLATIAVVAAAFVMLVRFVGPEETPNDTPGTDNIVGAQAGTTTDSALSSEDIYDSSSQVILGGTGGAPFVGFVDGGNNVSDKFPGLIAEVVDFDDNKNLLWVDFTNKGSEDHTVDVSFAIKDQNYDTISDMIPDATGEISVKSGTVTHTSFALSNYWKNGEIVTGRYALLLNIDGQSVQLNFDIYVVTP